MNPMLSMLMGQLRNQNPQAYNELNSLMLSGKSPQQVLNELLASGRFSQAQVDRARQMAQQYTQNANTQTIKKF